ncbi:NAD(P)-dependent oxidoreductase [Jiangella aurantiaca]|uniref:NAD(P)-dependent oxidoreductase n=1 Tax=Jiangella aurantiaca TaxID=2530373 RepID=A0A4V2YS52_9ACTN|nr:NAD(P)-dependent oxidoreductase [Jiangella aurantiaca]TDD68937.1 NAD(P)-dependent oxidoreductase [Jiangella aurantiaca]
MTQQIRVLGLGTMGGRAAAGAVAAGYDVLGYDPSPAARDAAAAAGVRVSDDAAAVVVDADLVLVSVPRPEHVRALATEVLVKAPAGAVVVDLSTIDPATARTAAGHLAEHGVTYVDAPVLGRPAGCGSWTLVCGGPAESIDAVRPHLTATVAARVVRVGDTGAGSVVKIANNLMFGAINAVTAEAITLCRRNGVDGRVFVDTVAESGAATVSNLFKEIAPKMVTGDDDPAFALELLAKDNRLALDLAETSGSPAPLARAVVDVNELGLEHGLGPRDSGALVRAYAEAGGAR